MTDNRRRNLGKCYIFSASGRINTDLKGSIDGRITQVVISDETRWLSTDYYVQTAALSSKSERAAAAMSSLPIVLPEGLPYLLNEIDARVFAGEDIWLYLPGKAGETL